MSKYTLSELETVLKERNPALIKFLQPGLPEVKIRKILDKNEIGGSIEPLIQLYGWKNGLAHDRELLKVESWIFPKQQCYFKELGDSILDFGFFKEAAENHPRLLEAVGRYFPIFWDGNAQWLAVDLDPVSRNRIMLVNTRTGKKPFQQAYESFDDFLGDLIRANQEDDGLACFQPK